MIIDGLQYCKWSRRLFLDWRETEVACVHATVAFWENCREAAGNIADFKKLIAANHDLVAQAGTVGEVRSANDAGKTAVVFGFQNCSPIENDIGLVKIFYDLGVRFMQLTYNNQTPLAAGCYEDADSGLSRFGRQVVREMNRVGMTVDMSHSAERSTLEAIEYSARPIAITHANPAAWSPGRRNKSDTVLSALFAGGGFLGFSLYPLHLAGGGDCTLDGFCRMIAEVAAKHGCDRIGIGSDLCTGHGEEVLAWMRNGKWTMDEDFGEGKSDERAWPAPPPWFCTIGGFANLRRGLAAAGFGGDDIAKILGRNWLEFFAAAFTGE